MIDERGQAAPDYVAVLLVVAVVVAAAAAVAKGVGATDVAGAVHRQMARALCVVGRGDCDVDRLPCVVRQRRTTNAGSVTVAIVQIGHERVVLSEERSDRTVAVTLIDQIRPGLEVGIGLGGKVSLGGKLSLALGGELSAAAVAVMGKGRTWTVPNADAADVLIERLRSAPAQLRAIRHRTAGWRGLRAELPPPPDQTFNDRGLAVTGGAGFIGGQLALEAEDVFGSRVDLASGRVTAYVRRRNALTATTAVASAAGGATEQYAVTYDRDGRPLDLVILASGTTTTSAGVPAYVRQALGKVSAREGSGRLWTTETHLDLSAPDNLVAARDFLRRVRSPQPRLGDVVRVSDALRRRLDAAGVIHARALELASSEAGVSGKVALGLKVGGKFEHSTQTARLVEAATRGIDGIWRRREDCLQGLSA